MCDGSSIKSFLPGSMERAFCFILTSSIAFSTLPIKSYSSTYSYPFPIGTVSEFIESNLPVSLSTRVTLNSGHSLCKSCLIYEPSEDAKYFHSFTEVMNDEQKLAPRDLALSLIENSRLTFSSIETSNELLLIGVCQKSVYAGVGTSSTLFLWIFLFAFAIPH